MKHPDSEDRGALPLSGARIRLAYPDERRSWFDDELVVFNPMSWEIHVLNPAASLVFEFIAEAPREPAQIVALMHDVLVDAERDCAARHAATVIEDLRNLGLLTED